MQKQPLEVLYKKAVLKYFVIYSGKHPCWSFFLIKNYAKYLRASVSNNIWKKLLLKIRSELTNNTVYDKTTENLRNRVEVSLINNAKDYNKYVSKASFVSQKIFIKILVAIHEIKPVLTLEKPIYVGFSILDLGILLRHEFHYKYIEKKI